MNVQEENYFQAVFETNPIGMIILDEKMFVANINDAAVTLIGVKRENIINKKFSHAFRCTGYTTDAWACESGQRCQACLIQIAVNVTVETGQSTTNIECHRNEFSSNDQFTEHRFRASVTPIQLCGRRNVLVALVDISEKRNKGILCEREVAEEVSRKYQLLSEYTLEIILFIDDDGYIVEANNAAIQAYGYVREELLNMKISDLKENIDINIYNHRKTDRVFETKHIRKNGVVFTVEVN